MSWFIVSVPSKEHERKLYPNTTSNRFQDNEEKKPQPNGNVQANGPQPIRVPPRYIVKVPEEDEDQEKQNDEDEDNLPLEKVLENVLQELDVVDAVWAADRHGTFYQVYFPSEPGLENDRILRILVEKGIGVKHGSTVGIVPCTVFYRDVEYSDEEDFSDGESDTSMENKHEEKKSLKGFKALQKEFLKSVTARLTVAQVVDKVRSDGAILSFDYLLFATVASMVAALGLLENSSVNIVASMLISPIMGPIMAVSFGLMIRDRKLVTDGVKTELCGLIICLLSGFMFGVICGNWKWGAGDLPTNEQIGRGQVRSLWVGVLVALPSGAGVALSVLGGNHASLVGVAISASLLPPAVNCGILWGLSLLKYSYSVNEVPQMFVVNNDGISENITLPPSLFRENFPTQFSYSLDKEFACLGIFSLLLTIVNIACIIIAAVLVLKIKEVAPYTSVHKTERFWKHDVKIARDYNRTVGTQEGEVMGARMLHEWARLTGLDPKEVLGDSEEARLARLQTVRDIAKDVEDDEVYRTVMKCMGSAPSPKSLEDQLHPSPALLNPTMEDGSKPAVWDVEYGQPAGGRRFSFFPGQDKMKRKASRVASAIPTISQGLEDSTAAPTIPGVETNQLPPPELRSRMLRRSLANIDNPYTLWPSQNPTRRVSMAPPAGMAADGSAGAALSCGAAAAVARARRKSTVVPRFVVTPAGGTEGPVPVGRRKSRFTPAAAPPAPTSQSSPPDVTQL